MKTKGKSCLEPPAPDMGKPPAASGVRENTAANVDRILRVKDLVRPHGILPVCRSTFLNWARNGRISPGIRLGPRTRVWKESEIRRLIDSLEGEAHNG
jgi:predicted DNA-binding transcriptional regulator AlpA